MGGTPPMMKKVKASIAMVHAVFHGNHLGVRMMIEFFSPLNPFREISESFHQMLDGVTALKKHLFHQEVGTPLPKMSWIHLC